MKRSVEADRIYLGHILEAARKIMDYAAPGKDNFLEDSMTRDAIARNFEIIGEATKRLTEQTRLSSPDLPWKDIAGFRDFLIHGYDRVTPSVVWNIVEVRLPRFIEGVERMLGDR